MSTHRPTILLTGSTGFIGHHVCAELLRAGHRCLVAIRGPLEEKLAMLRRLLGELGIDAEAALESGRLEAVEWDATADVPHVPTPRSVDVVLHAAASTRFDADGSGEPERTNVEGTRRLLAWCAEARVDHFALVSSAYACGRASPAAGPVVESTDGRPVAFHNDYEETKRRSEELCVDWMRLKAGRSLAIFRPSVVVGAFDSGRATKFDAFYIAARATELLARGFAPDDPRRHAVPLHVRGRAGDRQDIVPVDYVAAMIARLLAAPLGRGRVYHLTNPNPPTNAQIKRAFERYYDLAGGSFVDPAIADAVPAGEFDRLFADVSRPVEHYMIDTPTFARANAAAAERAFGIECPTYDDAAIFRLLDFARTVGWSTRRRRAANGRPRPARRQRSPFAVYFETFLPRHVNESRIASISGVFARVRFAVEDEPGAGWLCTFEDGRLADVRRVDEADAAAEDISYRTSADGFWKSISGRVSPQRIFRDGDVTLGGNLERALRLAVILNVFAREFPCDAATLQAYACVADEEVAHA